MKTSQLLQLFVALASVLVCVPALRAQGADTCNAVYNGGQVVVADSGICDTIRLGWPPPLFQDTLPVPGAVFPDSIAIPMYIFTDQSLGAFSLEFTWRGSDSVYISSWRLGRIIPAGGTKKQQLRKADKRYSLGWISFDPEILIPDTGHGGIRTLPVYDTLGVIYLRIPPGTPRQWVNFDSLLISNTNRCTLSPSPSGGTVWPQYSDAGTPDIFLPVQEFESANLPQDYSLSQNSPNPFNPSTAIDFAIPKSGQVKIEIFNVLGQKVKTLIDEYLKSGYKRVEWDGTDQNGDHVSSGVYLYRMSANEFTETKKMLMLK